MKHTLILVLGLPATGKTSLAREIAEEFNLPLICKDDIKEIIFDTIGWSDRDWSIKVGKSAFAIMDYIIEQQLKSGCSLIVESPFNPRFTNPQFAKWQATYNFKALQVLCHADGKVLTERFKARGAQQDRHPGHRDEHNLSEFSDKLIKGKANTLTLDGDIVEVDTTDFDKINKKLVFDQIRSALQN